jgi:GNAT superfamily N-acetyltransferase
MTVISPVDQTDLELFCSLRGLSDLSPAIVRRHAPDALLMSREQGRLLARASLWWRQVPELSDERVGLIGQYAAQDSRAAATILADACRALAVQGCSVAVGPMDGSTWRSYRLLTERGDAPPFFLEPDNPDDWPLHFETAGFQALAHYYSSINEDNARCKDRTALTKRVEREGYTLRPLASHDMQAELGRLWQLSSEAFRDNFLYVPISEAEFLDIYTPLLAQLRPELVVIMEWHGSPVAFCLALPDLLQAKRGQPVDTVIFKSIAVLQAHHGKGLAAVMLAQINRTARALGMHRTIHALMHEDNASRLLDRPLMRDFRRYTIYARPL